MSETVESTRQNPLDFDPILPDTGILFYEECPTDYVIERPKLLPLKTSTQIRFEELQHEAARIWREKQKTAKTSKKSQ